MSWKCSPLIIITSRLPPDPSPPPSRTRTVVTESRFCCSLMPALGNLLHLPADAPGWTQGAKSACPSARLPQPLQQLPRGQKMWVWTPQAQGPGAQVSPTRTQPAQTNPSSSSSQGRLSTGSSLGSAPKRKHTAAFPDAADPSARVFTIACQCPTFFISSGLWCSTTAALDKVLKNFLLKEGDPICLRYFQSQADTVLGGLEDFGGINSVWELGMQAGTWLTYFIMFLKHVEALQFYLGKCVYFVGHFTIWILLKLEQNESFNTNTQRANFKEKQHIALLWLSLYMYIHYLQ